jgi:hypothetical protein
MHGHWSPKKSRAEYDAYEARVAEETARLQDSQTQAA